MKTIKLTYLLLLISFFGYSQVGVGNTDPKASLDVTASNPATPANTDGILIPRIDNFPTTNPTVDQDGMMVFVTGNGTPAKGFYYWDNGTSSWISVIGVKKINDLDDGKSDNDGSNDGSSLFLGSFAGGNDNSDDNRNVGIGYNAMANNISGSSNTAMGYQSLLVSFTGSDNTALGSNTLWRNTNSYNTAIGSTAMLSNTIGQYNTAIGYAALSTNVDGTSNVAIGSSTLVNNNAGNNNIAIGANSGQFTSGSYNILIGSGSGQNETGSHKLYIENTNANSDNALIYGEFDNDILRTNGEFQVGNPATTGYSLPTVDGSNGQILVTNGAGQTSFIDVSSIFSDTTNTLDQAYDQSIPGPNQGATIIADNGPVSISGGDGFNVRGDFGAAGAVVLSPPNDKSLLFFNPYNAAFRAGFNQGSDWEFPSQGDYSVALGYSPRATGNRSFAVGNSTEASGESTTSMGNGTIALSFAETSIGTFNTNYIPNSATNFDINDRLLVVGNGISPAARHNALTIFKSGLMNINEEYNMPLNDGTNGQVMTTDGAGNVTFQNPTTDTDNQQIDNLVLVGTVLGVSLEDDGIAPVTVNLAPLQDGIGTDNQQIDSFGLAGNTLGISLEDDAQPVQTVDLNNLSFNVNNFSLLVLYRSLIWTHLGTGYEKIPLDFIAYDTQSEFNTSNNRFIANNTGFYRINAAFKSINFPTPPSDIGIAIYKNGTLFKESTYTHNASSMVTRDINCIVQLDANEYIEFYIYSTSPGFTMDNTPFRSWFEIERIR